MFIIREADVNDCEAICRVHNAAIREIAKSHYPPQEIEAWARPRKPQEYIEAIKHKEFYVAEENGVVLGFGTLNQEQSEVEAVYTNPEFVRRGIGSAILRKLEERAKELSLSSLKLDASLNAVAFYESAGYKSQNKTKHRLSSGVEIGCVLMIKDLSS